ncbi:MAG: DEAD/DEAH box helicase [Rubricoccaceae bacterium]|nr:DEAD/DEAH box helicase [Rubricoccaceae bacterium]
MTTFSTLGLSEPLVRGVLATGYTTPTPIQAAAIPVALDGRDLTGCAQTGTGKTAAFVLPLLHRLAEAPRATGRPVRALVVTPTRELALQIEESVRTYGRFTDLRSVAVYGGVGIGGQRAAFRRGVDVVIATPGRLLDHLGQGTLDLGAVEVLVLDEADRMLDMGFIPDVRRIVQHLPAARQTLLFSATMAPAVEALARTLQRSPARVAVGEQRSAAETVAQRAYRVPQERKLDLLLHVLRTEPVQSVLVFSRTKYRADRITKKLGQRGIAAAAIHSNRSQGQRQRALAAFRDGDVRVLVATDIAARGIDVDGISHVVNYDTPGQAADYIHRIGRTGRAEATGDAVTFVSHDEEAALRAIEKHTGRRIPQGALPDLGTASAPAASAPRGRGRGKGRRK